MEEIPGVNAQETSREALLESLREVPREALEFNRLDAFEAAGQGGEELALNLSSAGTCFGISASTAANRGRQAQVSIRDHQQCAVQASLLE